MTDFSKDNRQCGTCEFWSGERKFNQGRGCGTGIVEVISRDAMCYKRKVNIMLSGTCKDWSRWGCCG